MQSEIEKKTIEDFGEQWTHYQENEGTYASVETLADLCGPHFDIADLKGTRVADIGSGTGRIVNMLLDAGAQHVTAVEPSEAFTVLQKNTASRQSQITYKNCTGEATPPDNFDYVVSFGVIHHIHDPNPTMKAIFTALKPGGKVIIWLYGYEGNKLYLFFIHPLRILTKHMPHKCLHYFSKFLALLLDGYIFLCKYIKLPMHVYMNNVLAKWTKHVRFITIYDQLNPAYAKYYKEQEVKDLLSRAGFENIQLYHRHKYSWTAVAQKPNQ